MAEGGCTGDDFEDYSLYSDEAGCEGCLSDAITTSFCIDCKTYICKTCAADHEYQGHDVEDLITTGHQTDELRVVMVGKTGNGKSSSGNTLFQKHVFDNDGMFGSTTKRCKRVTKQVEGKPLVVIDTPGLFDTDQLNKEVTRKEIIRCLGLASPGLHACLLVLTAGRFTEEEGKTVDEFEDIFGKKILDYTILIFTKLDATNMTVDDFKKAFQSKSSKMPEGLLNLVERCNNRFIVFNNSRTVTEDERKNAVVSLIDMIKVMGKEASSPYYSHEMFEVAANFFRAKSRVLRRPDSTLAKRIKQMEIGRSQTIKENEERKRDLAKVDAQMAEFNEHLKVLLKKKTYCIIM